MERMGTGLSRQIFCCCAALLYAWTHVSVAAETGAGADASGIDFFERKIRPVLVEQCYKCHSAEAGDKLKGGLLLDTREGLLKGGDSGKRSVGGSGWPPDVAADASRGTHWRRRLQAVPARSDSSPPSRTGQTAPAPPQRGPSHFADAANSAPWPGVERQADIA